MSLTMHAASVQVFTRMLGNLAHCLDKAEAHAQARKFDPAVLMAVRLAPDMLPFAKQVQIACDTAKFAAARIAGIDAPAFEDNEASLADLRERIGRTVDFLQSVPVDAIDGTEGKDVVLPRRDGPITLKGEVYLRHYALPNFFFHVTTAYALLRHNGVDLGKRDYLGPLQ